jgi:predicted dinucleotide-binding enzyme
MKNLQGTCLPGRRAILAAFGVVAALCIASLGAAPAARAADAAGKPKIGILGSGKVGSNLGRVWAAAGYQVMFSSRNLEADQKLAAEIGPNAHAGTPQQAADFGSVLLCAVPYGALPELGKSLGNSLKGKVVIDACNPFPDRDGAVGAEGRAVGAGLMSARLLPGARIVRAFNAIGAARMGSVHETPGKVGMPVAGDDKKAIDIALPLIRDIGFEPVVVGGLAMGKFLIPGSPLGGEHTPQEIRDIAATLKP